MKYRYYLLASLLLCAACDDVPAPYEVAFTDEKESTYDGVTLPYTSSNLNSGFEIYTPADYPSATSWSTGSSYVQVSGYADSDGDGTKEYNLTKSYLITPALYTATTSSVVINFEYTIRYGSSLTADELAQNHQLLASANYTGSVENATWTALAFTPTLSPYSNWTTYSSGDIELPAEFQNKDNIVLAFFYQTTSTSSNKVSTWEIKDFMIYAGTPESTSEKEEDPEPVTPTQEVKTLPYNSTSLSDFALQTVTGIAWSQGNTYAKASGYVSSSKTYTPTEAWLVSPAISTEGVTTGVAIDVQQVIRYVSTDNDLACHTMWASTDYAGDVTTATWVALDYVPVASTTNDWTFYPAATVQLPSSLLGQPKVTVAYKFTCGDSNSTTWELKTFAAYEKAATVDPTPDDPTPEDPTPDEPSAEPVLALTFDIAANCFNIDTEKQSAAKTYAYENYSLTLTPSSGNSFYYNATSQYVILGKKGATLQFSAFDFPVAAIEFVGRTGASASVGQNIFVGETAVSTATTGATTKSYFAIDPAYQAAGTIYTLQVTTNHNTQFTAINIYKAQ